MIFFYLIKFNNLKSFHKIRLSRSRIPLNPLSTWTLFTEEYKKGYKGVDVGGGGEGKGIIKAEFESANVN